MPTDDDPDPGWMAGALAETLGEATGRHRRHDPVLPRTGGPSGNAVLTAWTGLILLVLSVGELLTLFDVRGLLSWHVAIGALLVPPAALKTATTGWRLARYYLGSRPYQEAGPPPTLLRLLGPLVVASTVGLLGTGIVLVLSGEGSSRHVLISLLGFTIDWITLHQIAFAVWASATGLHLLGRIVPAVRIAVGSLRRRVPGASARYAATGAVLAAAVGLAFILVHLDSGWADHHGFPEYGRHG
jgi:hypothetical protein